MSLAQLKGISGDPHAPLGSGTGALLPLHSEGWGERIGVQGSSHETDLCCSYSVAPVGDIRLRVHSGDTSAHGEREKDNAAGGWMPLPSG